MDIEDNTFSLLVGSLIKKGVENVDTSSLSPLLKEEFAIVAHKWFEVGNYENALKAYALVGDKFELSKIGKVCLQKFKHELAFEAFKYAQDPEGLVDVGNAFLGEGRLRDAYAAFKSSGNQEMIQFFENNFKEGIDYYI